MILHAELLQFRFGQPDPRRRQRTDLDHRRPPASAVNGGTPGNVVRSDPPLLVRRSRKRNRRFPSGNTVNHFHGVSGGVNIRIRGLKPLIDHDMPARTKLKSGGFCQPGIRLHANAHHNEIRRKFRTVAENGEQGIPLSAEAAQFRVQPHVHAIRREFRLKQICHFTVHRRKHMAGMLNHGHMKSAFPQVLRGFQSDKTAADHDRLFRPVLHQCTECIHIRNRPERMYARIIRPRQSGSNGTRSGRQQQFIIRFRIFTAVRPADRDSLFLTVQRNRLVLCTDLNIEPCLEFFLRHDQQGIPLRDYAAQMIRQAAIRIRDIGTALQQHDFHGFIQTAKSCRRARTRGNAADNNSFHDSESPLLFYINIS